MVVRGREWIMAYSDFTVESIVGRFSLRLDENADLFSTVGEIPISDHLRATLDENVPLALSIHTEKARSELIIAPILVELRKLARHRVSLFSGIDFTVDPERGLNGVCDYLISRSAEQLYVRAPVLVIGEAKNDNIKGGYGQCIAAMVAARTFNERANNGIDAVHGVVTTGSIWKFLQLTGGTVRFDVPEYYLNGVGKILGVLLHVVVGHESKPLA
jgi:hypothetical protein